MLDLIAAALLAAYVYIPYALFAIISAFPSTGVARSSESMPKVSIIIPTRNEIHVIERTLQSVSALDYPDFEILVADSSNDGTSRVAKKYAKVISVKPHGKPAALNAAIRRAKGEVLYFLDADCVVERDTLSRLVAALSPKTPAAAGCILPENSNGLIGRVARLYMAFLGSSQLAGSRVLHTVFTPGRNFVIYKNVLEGFGGFDDALTEDINLSFKLYNSKMRVAYVDATCREQVPHKLGWFIKQQDRWLAGGLHELVQGMKNSSLFNKSLLAPVGVTLALSPSIALAAAIAGLITSNIFAVAISALVLVIMILSSSLFLKPSDIVLSPLTLATLGLVQTGVVFSVLWKIVKHRRISWWKTPKD